MDTEKTIPQNIYKIFISAIAVLVSMWIMDNFIVDKDWYKYITSIPFFAQFFKIISLDKIFTTTIVIILYSYLYFQEILPCKRRKYQPVTKL